MLRDEGWLNKFNEVRSFIETNQRTPSRYDANERGLYCNWIKHNKKLLNSGVLRQERVGLFCELLAKMEENKRVNQ